MTTPAILAPNLGLIKKSTMRDMLNRVEDEAARRAGYQNSEDRLADAVNLDPENIWKLKSLQARVEPKEVAVTTEHSAESLLAALEAKRRGEYVEFEEVKTAEIVAEDAQFKQGGFRKLKGIAATI